MADLFHRYSYAWEVLGDLRSHVLALVREDTVIRGSVMNGAYVDPSNVFIDEGAVIEAGAYIEGPCYVGPGAEVRQGAYVRGEVILMTGTVLGHASEAKNSVLLPHAKAPHFAYVGDSVLGTRVNLGAGTKLSNVGITSCKDQVTGLRPSITLPFNNARVDTGLTKLGAILGDDCQTGCNCVLNPGTLLGPSFLVYPNTSAGPGYYPPGSILKLRQTIEVSSRQQH